MTVPKSTSHTVYFDPLIKYYERPIKNLPSTAPKDSQYSQFFEAPEFDTMNNRILSDFRYMQKPRSFQEAYDNNIIENNIKITIKNLFKPNGLFYIDKKPYTIVEVKSNPYDWYINEKPIEKLLNHFSHLSIDQIQKQANEEKEKIPEPLRQKNLASSNITTNENISIITSSLQNSSKKSSKQNIIKEISGDIKTFVDTDQLTSNDKNDFMRELYTKYLRKNIPINYTNIPDLTIDPITFSLLIKPEILTKTITTDTTKYENLLTLYSAFLNAKKNLKNADDNYNKKCIDLAQDKIKIDNDMDLNFQYLEHIIEKKKEKEMKNEDTTETKEEKKEKKNIIKSIKTLKINYMSFIFDLADLIDNIYNLQTVYFTTTKELLIEIKKNYFNIIQNY
jgi:hypothetical protein